MRPGTLNPTPARPGDPAAPSCPRPVRRAPPRPGSHRPGPLRPAGRTRRARSAGPSAPSRGPAAPNRPPSARCYTAPRLADSAQSLTEPPRQFRSGPMRPRPATTPSTTRGGQPVKTTPRHMRSRRRAQDRHRLDRSVTCQEHTGKPRRTRQAQGTPAAASGRGSPYADRVALDSAGRPGRGRVSVLGPRRQVLIYETRRVHFPDEVDLPDRYRPHLWRM